VPLTGQSWITPERLAARHANAFRQLEPGLLGIGTVPAFAIGQRAILVTTPAGNVLWDCISLLDRPISSADGPADAIRRPVLTPDRWLADFAKINIKHEVRPLILKENDGPAARPAAFLTHCAVGYERLDEYVQQLKGKEGDS